QAAASDDKSKKPPSKLVTLSGCVAADPAGQFTLSDAENGAYRLSGTNVREYVGRRVQVSGSTSRKLKVVGGLYPTPNVAAQAGAIDPVKAAREAAMASPVGTNPNLPEFRVKSVQEIAGGCPQQ